MTIEIIAFFPEKNPMNRVSRMKVSLYNLINVPTKVFNLGTGPTLNGIIPHFLQRELKLLLGKHFRGLDKDHRFLTPDGFKKHLSNEVYITQGFDHNLWVLSSETFLEIYQKLGHLNIADPMARLLFRLILGAATEAGLSEKGYLQIPDDLRDYANIDSEVLLVGQGNYFEIWSPEFWDQQEAELRKTASNSERFSTFELILS